MYQKESESEKSIKEVADELWKFLPPNFCYKNRDRKTMYNWIRTRLENLVYDREKEIAEEVEKKRMSLVEEIEFDVVSRNSNNMIMAYNSGLDEAIKVRNVYFGVFQNKINLKNYVPRNKRKPDA